MITRRTFLRNSMQTIALGSFISPFFVQCSMKREGGLLGFSGEIRGENFLIGHRHRDQLLSFNKINTHKHIYDVIIAGGGPAGLTSAWKLTKSGCDNYLILEKEEEIGGLCRGERENGLNYAIGAHYVDRPEPWATHLMELYCDCDIINGFSDEGWPIFDEACFVREPEHAIFAANKWCRDEFPFYIASNSDTQEYERFQEKLLEWTMWRDRDNRPAFAIPLALVSDAAEIIELDSISMADYLDQHRFNSALLRWYIENRMLDEYGTTLDRVSAWAGIQFFRTIKSDPTSGQPMPDFLTWPQGLSFITERLLKRIPNQNIKTGVYVISMKSENNLVQTKYYNPETKTCKIVYSRHAVFALPKNQAATIIQDLENSKRSVFVKCSYVPWLVAVVHLKRMPEGYRETMSWENTIFDSWSLGYINNQHQLTPPLPMNDHHTISLYFVFPHSVNRERAEILSYGWEHWARIVLHELKKAHHNIQPLIEKIDIWKWGHPMRQPLVGSVWGDERKIMLKPSQNIHFSHVDVAGIPVFEEAVFRGVEVAETILSQLGVTYSSSMNYSNKWIEMNSKG